MLGLWYCRGLSAHLSENTWNKWVSDVLTSSVAGYSPLLVKSFIPDKTSYIAIAGIILIDIGMQCIQISNQTSLFELCPSASNRVNTIFMTTYFIGEAPWGPFLPEPAGIGSITRVANRQRISNNFLLITACNREKRCRFMIDIPITLLILDTLISRRKAYFAENLKFSSKI